MLFCYLVFMAVEVRCVCFLHCAILHQTYVGALSAAVLSRMGQANVRRVSFVSKAQKCELTSDSMLDFLKPFHENLKKGPHDKQSRSCS